MPPFDHFAVIAPLYARAVYSKTKIMSEVAELPVKGRLLDVGGGTGRVSAALCEVVIALRDERLAVEEDDRFANDATDLEEFRPQLAGVAGTDGEE